MKRMIVLSMLGILLFTGTSRATGTIAPPPAPLGVWIKLSIVFHRPKKDCVSGFGICFMVTAGIDKPVGPGQGNLCPGRGLLNDRNQLVVEIDESALAAYEDGSVLHNFRGKDMITIPDPYPLPDVTCRALGSLRPLIIEPGNYPVTYKKGTYTVVFQL
jgi:hypothetical protein